MKKFRLLAMTCALLLLLTACGSVSKGASMATADNFETADTAASNETATVLEQNRPSDAKFIYTGHLSLESTDFSTALDSVRALVGEYGGYFERQSVSRSSGARYANCTIRLPSGQFDAFMGAVSGAEGITVTDQTSSCDDVGEAYADIENRRETLQLKIDRLQALLAQAVDMSDLIELESAISEAESELEQLTGEKNRYDGLIDYATVYLYLDEVTAVSGGADATFGQRLGAGFVRGVRSFVSGCGDAVVWLVSHIITVVLAAAVIVVLVYVLRRRRKKKAQNTTQNN